MLAGWATVSTVNPDSEILAWIGLRRVHGGGVANVAGCWVDGGYRLPSHLSPALDELTDAGLVTLADDGPHGPLRRATLTDAGQARYAELLARHGVPRTAREELPVPGPELSATVMLQTPADHRLSGLSPLAPPGGRPDSTTSDAELRWARDSDDGRLHALAPGDVRLGESRGYAECLCRHTLPSDLIFEPGPSGAVCLLCVIGVAPDLRALGLLDT